MSIHACMYEYDDTYLTRGTGQERERERETESEREKRKVKVKKKSRKREFAQPQSAWRGLGAKKQSKSKHWMDMGRA